MMLNGYCLIARDYKAEIVEFQTLSIVNMPDDSKLYLVHTKYGDDYMSESDLSPTRERFEEECKAINESFAKIKGDERGAEKRIYKPR